MPELYDDVRGILRKALIGSGLEPSVLAEKLRIPASELKSLYAGNLDAKGMPEICEALGLRFEALKRLVHYRPPQLNLAEVSQINLPFEGDSVNVWHIETPTTSVVFDAGFIESDLAEALSGRAFDRVFITHPHRDHIGGINFFKKNSVSIESADKAVEMTLGDLQIRPLDLAGHCIPAVGYHVLGLEIDILVVGDAIYAGSIGYCPDPASYQLALKNLRAAFSEVSEDCIVLPGHGPATTVKSELESNPFF